MVDTENKVENTTSDTTGKDITNEVEVDESEVKLYTIEELVPSSTPITIPYLEIYRTNELEYIPYLSPYNVGCSASDSSSSDTSSEDTTDTENTDENSAGTDGTGTDTNTGTGNTQSQ